MAAENSIISISTPKPIKTTPDNNEPAAHKSIQQHPRHGSATNIFKVALFMMRGSSRKSRVIPVDEESKGVWRKLVGSMRPLHLQSNNSPPPQPQNNSNRKLKKMVTMPCKRVANYSLSDGFEYAASDFTNSPSPSHCRYASAIGLSEMVKEEDEENQKEEENVVVENEEEESDGGDGDGDEMIDVKAEEFIAQFYQQMRLQKLDIVHRRYNEISHRSLGL